ncbi:MAG: hypothetical protein LBV12_03200 [Puniceicoccales bacterium]|jgi:tRNA threonylcarbamoyladenosine biosynthesis protein TsaB|nr:hypothetical protein [Puniceicoccales bacterium]
MASDSTVQLSTSLPYLFLDAAGREPIAGVWQNGQWLAYQNSAGLAATEGLFSATDAVLKSASLGVEDCAGFIFVEGPGSILGIRIAAMAIRGWKALPGLADKPVYATGTLSLAAHLLLREDPSRQNFSLLADSRQGRWNVAIVDNGTVPSGFEEIRGEHLAELPTPRYRITQRALGAPPVECLDLPSALLKNDPGVLSVQSLLHIVESPDALNMPGEFSKWEPQRHR